MSLLLLALACASSEPAPAPPVSDPVLVLDPPIAGQAGIDWTIQNHVDVDPGPGERDSLGGQATYDGHKGTDFGIHGLPAMVEGVEVLAPAAGTVLRTRDDQPDQCRSDVDQPEGVECGNGMVIDHGDGFTTQLCHLRMGGVQVEPGQEVQAGDVLGLVGWSGFAEFPHVHLTVRRDDQVLDPFAAAVDGPRAEWRHPDQVPPATHVVWATGFTGSLVVNMDSIQRDPVGAAQLPDDADAVQAYALGLVNGEHPAWSMLVTSPSGRPFTHDGSPKGRASSYQRLGKRRRQGETLEHGTWTARLVVDGDEVHEWSVEVVPGPVADEPAVSWEGCAPAQGH